MQVRVYVTPRESVLDPQGKVVEHALASLGFHGVSGVRIGKYIRLEIDASSEEQAREMAAKMCHQLLANPLIEDYTFEVVAEPVETESAPVHSGRKFNFEDQG